MLCKYYWCFIFRPNVQRVEFKNKNVDVYGSIELKVERNVSRNVSFYLENTHGYH